MNLTRLPTLRAVTCCCRYFSQKSFPERPEKLKSSRERYIAEVQKEAEDTPTTTRIKVWWYTASRFKKSLLVWMVGAYCWMCLVVFTMDKEAVDSRNSPAKVYGELAVGGPFELRNTKGQVVSTETLKGKWVLLYFGFTYCPDICPEQMEMMGEVTETLKTKHGIDITPLMITIDIERDTQEQLEEYLADYHPAIQGLLGSEEQIDGVCNAFRCYRSKGQAYDDPNDYILDHTVTQYIIDPEGRTVGYFMSNRPLEDRVPIFLEHFDKYKKSKEGIKEKPDSIFTRVTKALGTVGT